MMTLGSVKRLGVLWKILFGCVPLWLTGCAGNWTGLMNAADQFGCGLPDGISCQSLSQTYEQIQAENQKETIKHSTAVVPPIVVRTHNELNQTQSVSVDATRSKQVIDVGDEKQARTIVHPTGIREQIEFVAETASFQRSGNAKNKALGEDKSTSKEASETLSARVPEQVVMLWILPWVDVAGDLHDQTRLWVRVTPSYWRLERLRRQATMNAPLSEEP